MYCFAWCVLYARRLFAPISSVAFNVTIQHCIQTNKQNMHMCIRIWNCFMPFNSNWFLALVCAVCLNVFVIFSFFIVVSLIVFAGKWHGRCTWNVVLLLRFSLSLSLNFPYVLQIICSKYACQHKNLHTYTKTIIPIRDYFVSCCFFLLLLFSQLHNV